MTIEAPERVDTPPPSPRHRRQVHTHSDRRMGRRRFLAGLGGGLVGLGIGAYAVDRWLSSTRTPEQRPPQDYNIEVRNFPNGYRHDLMFPPLPKAAATDAGASVEVSPGVYLVTLSDTLQGTLEGPQDRQRLVRESRNWINNLAVLFDENKQKVTFISGPSDKKGRDTSWIKPPPDAEEKMINAKDGVSTYYWTQTPIVEHGTVVVTLARNKPNNNMLPDPMGTDIAFFRDGIDQPPDIIKLPRTDYHTSSYFTTWGTSVMQDGKKEWTYIAGSTEPRDNNPFNTKELRMARAPYGRMDNLQQWQFWNGKDWVGVEPAETYEELNQAWKKAENEAGTIIDYTRGISQGYSMNLIDGKVVLTTKNTDFLGETVDVFLGDTPTGPFQKHTIINKEDLQKLIPDTHRPQSGKSWTYLALLHPELPDPEGKNRMLITFCVFPDVEKPNEAMMQNVNTYSRIPVWIDRNKILNPDASKT